MTNARIDQLVQVLNQKTWPKTNTITPQAREMFLAGLDAANTYSGNFDDLLDPLQGFFQIGVLSYALAGSARILSLAAFIGDDRFDPDGLQKAQDLIRTANRFSPGQPEIELVEAGLWINLKQYPNARQVLDRISKADFMNIHLCLVEMSYWSNFDIAQSEAWFRRANSLNVSVLQRAILFNRMARQYLVSERYDQALDLYWKTAEMTPQDPWVWHNMSVIYLRQNKLVDSFYANQNALHLMDFAAAREIHDYLRPHFGLIKQLEDAQESLRRDPRQAGLYLRTIAEIYFSLGQTPQALKALNELLKPKPKDAEMYNLRGRLFNRLQQFDDAIEDFSQAIKIQPKNPDYPYNRGNSYYARQDFRRAAENYGEAIKLKPDYVEAYTNRAACYRMLKNFDKALADYNKAISLRPNDPVSYLDRSQVYQLLNKIPQARKDLEFALTLPAPNRQIEDEIRQALDRL